jgi:hypothetical protein
MRSVSLVHFIALHVVTLITYGDMYMLQSSAFIRFIQPPGISYHANNLLGIQPQLVLVLN